MTSQWPKCISLCHVSCRIQIILYNCGHLRKAILHNHAWDCSSIDRCTCDHHSIWIHLLHQIDYLSRPLYNRFYQPTNILRNHFSYRPWIALHKLSHPLEFVSRAHRVCISANSPRIPLHFSIYKFHIRVVSLLEIHPDKHLHLNTAFYPSPTSCLHANNLHTNCHLSILELHDHAESKSHCRYHQRWTWSHQHIQSHLHKCIFIVSRSTNSVVSNWPYEIMIDSGKVLSAVHAHILCLFLWYHYRHFH